MAGRPASLRGVLVALAIGAAGPAAPAQTPGIVAAAVEGTGVRPIARFDDRWVSTCAAPPAAIRERAGDVPRVVASGAGVEAVRPVGPRSAEWAGLEPLVTRLFQERERRENVSAATLATVATRIEAIVASAGTGDQQVYFFAASKTIPDTRGAVDLDADGDVDPAGDLRIDVTGFILRAGPSMTPLGTNATLSWEQVDDRPAAGTRRAQLAPLGIVRAPNGRVWVMRGRAGESTWYTLYEVGAGGVRTLVRSEPC